MLFEHFVNYGPLLLATDAGMSLLETRTMVTQACARYREKHKQSVPHITVFVAAWYPWHYKKSGPVRRTEFSYSRNPSVGLGLDSLAMFYVCDESCNPRARRTVDLDMNAAEVRLHIDHRFINSYFLR